MVVILLKEVVIDPMNQTIMVAVLGEGRASQNKPICQLCGTSDHIV